MSFEVLVFAFTSFSFFIQITKVLDWFNKRQSCEELKQNIREKTQLIRKNFQEIRKGLVICIKHIQSISPSDLDQEVLHEAEANITRVYDLMIDSFEKLAELKTLMSSHAINCLNNPKDRAKLRVFLENFDRDILKVINQMQNALSQIFDTSDPQEAIKSILKLFEVSEPTEDDKSLALPFIETIISPFIETIISVRGKISIEEMISAPYFKKYKNALRNVVEAGRPYNF